MKQKLTVTIIADNPPRRIDLEMFENHMDALRLGVLAAEIEFRMHPICVEVCNTDGQVLECADVENGRLVNIFEAKEIT